jgi:hypothetical protein
VRAKGEVQRPGSHDDDEAAGEIERHSYTMRPWILRQRLQGLPNPLPAGVDLNGIGREGANQGRDNCQQKDAGDSLDNTFRKHLHFFFGLHNVLYVLGQVWQGLSAINPPSP